MKGGKEQVNDEGIEVVYQASANGKGGYFTPVRSQGQFNVQTDNSLIAEGTHFFCQGHLGAVVIENQSRNKKYCSDCYSSVRER